MQTITFEQLPQAVSELHDKLNSIEELLREAKTPATKQDELLTISEAAGYSIYHAGRMLCRCIQKENP